MTDKQITIDYENLCANYSKEVGCYNTFDGSCIKEQCFTYRLLQLLKAKEQECEALQMSENEAGEIIAELEAYKDINEDFKTAWEELKAENEELKEQNIKLQNRNQQLSGAITQNLIYIQKLEKIEPLAIGLKQTDYQHIRQVGEKILQIIRDEEYNELVDLYKAKEQE